MKFNIFKRLNLIEAQVDLKWLSDKLYALNKLAKNYRADLREIYEDSENSYYFVDNTNNKKTREELYKLKSDLLYRYGSPTGEIHSFPRGYGVEYTITGKDSFHLYYKYFTDAYAHLMYFYLKDISIDGVKSISPSLGITTKSGNNYIINYNEREIYIEVAGLLKSEKKELFRTDIYNSKSKEKYRQKLVDKENMFIKAGLEYYILFASDLNDEYLNKIFN